MRRRFTVPIALIVASLAGCDTLGPTTNAFNEPNAPCDRPKITDGWLDAASANEILAGVPEHCQPGAFILTVRRYGRVGSVLYLDSEIDYRNPENISIAVLPSAQDELSRYFHGAPEARLVGKELVVVGTARRVPIYFETHGPSLAQFDGSGQPYAVPLLAIQTTSGYAPIVQHLGGTHYFQSHVLVESAAQMYLKQARASD